MANRKIAYTLGRGRAYIFDMSSTSGYMGEKYFQEFGPRFFDMSSASGYMGEKYFQEFGPRFLACHVIFGVSCSKCCVSWRVNIYRVNKFRVVSCHISACRRVRAMSRPPCSLTQARPKPGPGQISGDLEIWKSRKLEIQKSGNPPSKKNQKRVATTWHGHADTQNSDPTRHGTY